MRVQGGGFITHQYDMQREEEEGRGREKTVKVRVETGWMKCLKECKFTFKLVKNRPDSREKSSQEVGFT